jgi:hypothetical protein
MLKERPDQLAPDSTRPPPAGTASMHANNGANSQTHSQPRCRGVSTFGRAECKANDQEEHASVICEREIYEIIWGQS